MWTQLFATIDRVLRGQFTRKDELAQGQIRAPTRPLIVAATLLGCAYGAFMGLFALLREGDASFAQFSATVVKVPLLFLLTLAVTYPSLYVVSALFDSSLRFAQTLRLLLISILVNLALLASFGPVTGFFTLSTESYAFIVLLNVVLFAIAGLVGVAFLRRTLDHVFGGAPRPPEPAALEGVEVVRDETRATSAEAGVPGARLPLRHASLPQGPPPQRRIFRVWMLIYAIVGAQMGWILRPFIGNPDLPFQFFRPRGSNFFQAVIEAIRRLAQ